MQALTYELPVDRIAVEPLPSRDQSKLLVYDHGVISDAVFQDIAQYIPRGALIVRNISKVIPARIELPGSEVFLLKPVLVSYEEALNSSNDCEWFVMVRNPKKLVDAPVEIGGISIFVSRSLDTYRARFRWDGEDLFREILERIGSMPLPPYMNRLAHESDKERYQTVFANTVGSVAAPTASLHMTPEVERSLRSREVEFADVVLHVGLGTFLPIKGALEEHKMHSEQFSISHESLQKITKALEEGRLIIPMGTTAFRVIESLVWYEDSLSISQYQWKGKQVDVQSVYRMLANLEVNLSGETSIFCDRNYKPQVASGLITNFHQPGSTLLELVSACIGDGWREVYEHALHHDYRFLSYGDCSLFIFRELSTG
jgi:S-adenosylmethionine:tRNA ribosyltransferase-isomerase